MALVVAVLLSLPFVLGLVDLHRGGWVLTGDDALLGLRSIDVFSADRPLTGQPSTSETAGGGVRTYHPGPIEMYSFAPLVAVIGGWGMVVGAALANLASVLLAAWVIFRRLGPTGALVGVVLLALFERSVGVSLLVDPVSSNMWGVPIMAVAVCCWAVADGDVRLLPVTALVASWSAQQHLAAVAPTIVLVSFALLTLGARAARSRRRERRHQERTWLWLAWSVAIGLATWLPVAVQQLTGDPGNLSAVAEYSRVEGRTTQGLAPALDIATGSVWPVPAILRTEIAGSALAESHWVGSVLAVVVLALALVVVALRRVPRAARLLVGAGLAVFAAGILNSSNIPSNTIEVTRINLHRWIWPASTAVVVGVAWGLGTLAWPTIERRWARATRDGDRIPGALRSGPRLAVGLTAAIVLVMAVAPPAPRPGQDPDAPGLARGVLAAIEADLGDADTVLLIPEDPAADLSIVPAVGFALERDGINVVVPERNVAFWGPQRDADSGWDVARISTRIGSPAGVRGELVDDVLVDPRLRPTLGRLVPPAQAQAQAQTPVVNIVGDRILAVGTYDAAVQARAGIAAMATDPQAALLVPEIVDLILKGGVDGLDLPRADLRAHAELLAEDRTVWSSRRLLVFRLSDADARTLMGALPDGPVGTVEPPG